jgi:hypothetical protein
MDYVETLLLFCACMFDQRECETCGSRIAPHGLFHAVAKAAGAGVKIAF